jgi:hypothetical protein
MKRVSIVDFYSGWAIEVSHTDAGYQFICYSPTRQRLFDRAFYSSDATALSAAKQLIAQYLACQQLTACWREMYELGTLSFEDWRSLNHALNAPFSAQSFTES